MDSTDISTSGKGKAPVSTNGVEAYSKKVLGNEIRRLTTANAQLVTDKMETEKARVNLEADRIRLFGEKNSLVAKKKELRIKIATLNAVGFSNVPIRGYQNLFLRLTRDKFKVKRLLSFDGLKENL